MSMSFTRVAGAVQLLGAPSARHVVLVHGAFMGGWAWEPVAAQLRRAGDRVTVVDLPCHEPGARSVAGATLDAYVDRVGEAVGALPMPAVLVGHSMAGMVISQYAERAPEKVDRLVYLAAYLPSSGQRLLDLAFTDAGSEILKVVQIDEAAGRVAADPDALLSILAGDCAPEQAALLRDRYHDEPLLPLATPVTLTRERWGAVPKSYLFTEGDRTISFALQRQMASRVVLSGAVTLRTAHTPQLSAPGAVVAALRKLLPWHAFSG